MLQQLATLSVESDGRYATDSELEFITKYLETLETRISAYEKIREAHDKLLSRVEKEKREMDPNLFILAGKDVTGTCQRDVDMMLKYTSAALLLDDLDHLRQGPVLWYQTLVKSFKYQEESSITYRLLEKLVRLTLTPEEAKIASPAFQVNASLL